jgi:Immunoglobulin-like domain of bacterial spore germination
MAGLTAVLSRAALPAVVVVAIVAAGCGSTETVTVTTTVTRTVTTTTPAAKKTVRAYFMRDGKVGPVARAIEQVDRASLLAAVAAGPTDAERAIGFTQGEATERTAEEVYTLSQFDRKKPVEVAGKSYTRADFEDLTPAILVESPLPFAAVSSPLRVWGTANTFEATFEYELLDAAGKALARHFVTATSGSGTRGTYDVTIRFTSPGGPGKLVVYELSAADGSRIHQVEIPLTLAP